MIRLLLGLLLVCTPAHAETVSLLKSWGDNRPADQFISITANRSGSGYDLMVVADDRVNPVAVVVITANVKVLATCRASVCLAYLPIANMAIITDLLVLVADTKGAKFNLSMRLTKP